METQRELYARQGDVLAFRRLTDSTITEGTPAKLDQDGSLTIATGTATGHRHRFANFAENGGSAIQNGDTVHVLLQRDQVLIHEEHGHINVPAGAYDLEVQRQYQEGAIQNVLD